MITKIQHPNFKIFAYTFDEANPLLSLKRVLRSMLNCILLLLQCLNTDLLNTIRLHSRSHRTCFCNRCKLILLHLWSNVKMWGVQDWMLHDMINRSPVVPSYSCASHLEIEDRSLKGIFSSDEFFVVCNNTDGTTTPPRLFILLCGPFILISKYRKCLSHNLIVHYLKRNSGLPHNYTTYNVNKLVFATNLLPAHEYIRSKNQAIPGKSLDLVVPLCLANGIFKISSNSRNHETWINFEFVRNTF